ncbi:hypothetical protein V6N11_072685 [Hibiscus sabdariffa]|uniref:RNase H type-1 domain-containing protein n=1 Tax=Hibiscus sabdariffa TaxID=183260 RepID=A0ABR2U446_9ROSI
MWIVFFISSSFALGGGNCWVKPPAGSLKFNIDGAVVAGFGRAGIGGILRNPDNESLISFSKSVGITDATSAELLAFKEACVLFGESKWAKSFAVIFESDCSLISRWSFNVVPSCANLTADKLTKAGINSAMSLKRMRRRCQPVFELNRVYPGVAHGFYAWFAVLLTGYYVGWHVALLPHWWPSILAVQGWLVLLSLATVMLIGALSVGLPLIFVRGWLFPGGLHVF